MLRAKNQVGGHASSPSGKIFVLDSEGRGLQKEPQAHMDGIQALCSAEDCYMLSCSAKLDGKITIWKVE